MNKTVNYHLPVRLSHLLRHCSVGAIVRTPPYLLTIKDITYWANFKQRPLGCEILYVEQVKQAMGIKQKLYKPPIASIESDQKVNGSTLPAQIFPTWYVCKKCDRLTQYPYKTANDEQKKTGSFRCNNQCTGVLEQVTLVQVHQDGSLNDVPWHWLIHKGEKTDCRRMTWNAATHQATCLDCKRSEKIKAGDSLPFIGYSQPWISSYNKDRYPQEGKRQVPAILMAVNDTRVHSSINKVALVIPPESRIKRGGVLDRLYHNESLKKETLALFYAPDSFKRRQHIKLVEKKLGCSEQELQKAVEEINKGYPLYHKTIQSGGLLEDEYEALTLPLQDLHDDEDFVTKHLTKPWQALCEQGDGTLQKIGRVVDKAVAVNRLKEIMVLQGFSRGGILANADDKPLVVPPDIVGQSDWLPALELYGEGIFIGLNEAVVQAWERYSAVVEREERLHRRLESTSLADTLPNDMSARFLLLHTLSHLLIKELESQAGYPAASLKEKIYSSTAKDKPMAGILIYVAIPDVSGSLGGLCELAEPKRLARLLVRVFEKATWCSLDPVCATHTGQGPALLNLAACHACLLVPETSCCCGNILLDRTFIKGGEGLPSILETTEKQ